MKSTVSEIEYGFSYVRSYIPWKHNPLRRLERYLQAACNCNLHNLSFKNWMNTNIRLCLVMSQPASESHLVSYWITCRVLSLTLNSWPPADSCLTDWTNNNTAVEIIMICILCVVSYTIPDTTFPRHKIQVRHINRPACKLYWIIANKKLIAVEEREACCNNNNNNVSLGRHAPRFVDQSV